MKEDTKMILPEAKPMTRRQWIAFKESGLDPAFQEDTAEPSMLLRLQANAYDWIIKNVYDAEALADFPMNQLNRLAEQTYFLTYGRAEAEKN